MTVYLVGAGPGDPGLLTLRGAEVLRRAEVVVYDRLSVAALVDMAPATAQRISVGKTPRGPSTPQDEINALLVEHGRAGREVVRLKGGDPFVFARGGEEAAALAAAGVTHEIVPGVTSAVAAPAYAGVPLTHRGLSTSFTVVTGHEDPWAATETDWEAVARVGGTTVVLMGVATRADIARRLMQAGRPADTPVVAVQWGTTPRQRTMRTTLAGLGAAPLSAPATIVIGAVAGLDLAWFERRPLFGRRVVVTRAREQASELRARLEELGAEVVEVPTIAIRPAEVDLAGYVQGADWVVLTSANAVAQLCSQLRDARSLGTAKVAAVGPGTAEALRVFGVRADLVPERTVAEGLVDVFPHGPGRVFLPQAAGARPVVAEGLAAKGWTVDAVTAYSAVGVAVSEAQRAAARGADAIAFTASSTVTNYLGSADPADVPGVVVCIGPVTAETAGRLGLEVTAVAEPHTLEGLVAALQRALTP
ncbi:MAG: uroporphyrinogen-III C-methyltransferase [Actinobacteria bacterium]|nr:uroporphyrinogen-III C-methyltransferase [Actinomycetota bacterium]MBW3649015.1 uroporphyrinogen-III C-methyltransferase [Actinomycetota bacterium]